MNLASRTPGNFPQSGAMPLEVHVAHVDGGFPSGSASSSEAQHHGWRHSCFPWNFLGGDPHESRHEHNLWQNHWTRVRGGTVTVLDCNFSHFRNFEFNIQHDRPRTDDQGSDSSADYKLAASWQFH